MDRQDGNFKINYLLQGLVCSHMQMSNFNNMYIDPTGSYLENTLAADAPYFNLMQIQIVKEFLHTANLNQSPSIKILLLPISRATVCISHACSGVNNSGNPQTVTSVDEDK